MAAKVEGFPLQRLREFASHLGEIWKTGDLIAYRVGWFDSNERRFALDRLGLLRRRLLRQAGERIERRTNFSMFELAWVGARVPSYRRCWFRIFRRLTPVFLRR
jgi:hypothetical protein